MSKFDEHGEHAKNLYCVHQLTLSEIAKRLGIAYRTLQNWKTAGNWEAQRSALRSSETAFHQRIFELGEKMTAQIISDMENGNEIAPARYFSLAKIIETASKARDYEKEAVPAAPADERTPEERAQAAMAKIKGLLGL